MQDLNQTGKPFGNVDHCPPESEGLDAGGSWGLAFDRRSSTNASASFMVVKNSHPFFTPKSTKKYPWVSTIRTPLYSRDIFAMDHPAENKNDKPASWSSNDALSWRNDVEET